MQATQINVLRLLLYVLVMANIDPKTPESKKPKEPTAYPLPGEKNHKPAGPKPGSFAFIAKAHAAAVRKNRQKGGG